MSSEEHRTTTTTVSTHVLDTSAGRPAPDVGVALDVRAGSDARWLAYGSSRTDGDGRCTDLPALPETTTHVRFTFATGPYHKPESPAGGHGFFPEVTVVFAVTPGEHHHVPLLLSPFGYSVYRGS
jgi:hydroxyisourate hydrolase